MANIMDGFKNRCTITMKPINNHYEPKHFKDIEIIAFDIIGLMIQHEQQFIFIPWGSIDYIIANEVNL